MILLNKDIQWPIIKRDILEFSISIEKFVWNVIFLNVFFHKNIICVVNGAEIIRFFSVRAWVFVHLNELHYLSQFMRWSLIIFIIQYVQTIVFIFTFIFTTFRPIHQSEYPKWWKWSVSFELVAYQWCITSGCHLLSGILLGAGHLANSQDDPLVFSPVIKKIYKCTQVNSPHCWPLYFLMIHQNWELYKPCRKRIYTGKYKNIFSEVGQTKANPGFSNDRCPLEKLGKRCSHIFKT